VGTGKPGEKSDDKSQSDNVNKPGLPRDLKQQGKKKGDPPKGNCKMLENGIAPVGHAAPKNLHITKNAGERQEKETRNHKAVPMGACLCGGK